MVIQYQLVYKHPDGMKLLSFFLYQFSLIKTNWLDIRLISYE